jgi:hypothetical protein
MKIKSGFMLRELAGEWVVVPLGERVVEFNGIITISESGALLWKQMEQMDVTEDEMVKVMLTEYEIDKETARNDIREFINIIKEKKLVE